MRKRPTQQRPPPGKFICLVNERRMLTIIFYDFLANDEFLVTVYEDYANNRGYMSYALFA